MDLNADLNNVPIRDENPATTLLTRTAKPLERRQDIDIQTIDSIITSPPTTAPSVVLPTSSRLTVTSVSGEGAAAPITSAATTTSQIFIFPDCLTCAPDPSAIIPAAITEACAEAHWTLIRLSTAYIWAPVVGCSGEQPECCVYGADPVSTITETTTDTIGQLVTATHTQHEQVEDYPFPTASNAGGESGSGENRARETLVACPADHETVAGDGWRGCCPFGFTATAALGAQVPCATAYPHSLDVPEVPSSLLPTKGHVPVVQTISDSIYAVQYSLEPPPETGREESMSMGKKAGIAVGSGIAGVIFGILLGWAIMRNRRRDREIEAREQTEKESEGKGKGKGKEKEVVECSKVPGQQQIQTQWPSQQQPQPQLHPQLHSQSQFQPPDQQELQIYPVYPPAQLAYNQQQDDNITSPVSPTSPTSPASPTTGSLSWGTSSQPLYNSYNSYYQPSSSQAEPSQGRHPVAGPSQIPDQYGGVWGR